ncbi:hypothetical protein KPSB59_4120004 [Klebsiella quasipneumoniae subsp. quasipneumoniae]|nr:hypothetical protein KPSB59_4120004 [Klebsiella quasipneumoniae subsp. quasipneumoniae]
MSKFVKKYILFMFKIMLLWLVF